jgi:putative RNA 2'-phosphotransferase
MDASELKSVSKNLSYVLRHRPDSVGLSLDANGWVAVSDLIDAFLLSGKSLSEELLAAVVAGNDKQRFEFNDDRTQIRARQGHSVPVDLAYAPALPPELLYHGTARHNLESIFESGLLKGRRHHVHLSTNKATMLQVAMRHGKPVILLVHAQRMYADGHVFFVTGNNVWLTDHVPPAYLAVEE